MKSFLVCVCLLSLSVFADQIGNVAGRQLGGSFYTKTTETDPESGLLLCPFEPTSGKVSNATQYIAYVTPKSKLLAGVKITLKKAPGFGLDQLISAMRKKYPLFDFSNQDYKREKIIRELRRSGAYPGILFALTKTNRYFDDGKDHKRLILLFDKDNEMELFYVDFPTYQKGEKETSKVDVSGL